MGREDHRPGASGCVAPHDGRSDRTQRGHGALPKRRAAEVRGGADRRQRTGHPDRRRPGRVRQGNAADRSQDPGGGDRHLGGGRPRGGGALGLSRDPPALVHAGRHGGRDRLQSRGVRGHAPAWSRSVAGGLGAGGAERDRLEGVRARGNAGRGRQRGHRLLDRESRPDGRAHRRFHHRRPGDDALGSGVPSDARRLLPGDPRGRGRGRRLQHPVRGEPHHGRAAGDRDEPAGFSKLGPGLQGHRLSDRPDRHQGGGGLSARRAAQRHHQDHAGQLRAGARLRGGKDSPVRLREVPFRRSHAHDADEVGRRGDGHRPDLQGGVSEGLSGSRNGPHRVDRRRDAGGRSVGGRVGRGHPGGDPDADPGAGVPDQAGAPSRRARGADRRAVVDRSLVHPPDAGAGGRRAAVRRRVGGGTGFERDPARAAGRDPADEADGLLRRAAGRPGRLDRGGPPAAPARARHPAGLQDRRYLRRRVPVQDAVPLLLVRRRERGRSGRRQDGGDPGQRPEPDRPGRRVRLLLRPSGHGVPRDGLSDGHGELQPGDRVHRLRHVRCPLLRAAHPGGRPGDRAPGAAPRGRGAVRRADAPPAGPGSRGRGRADPGHLAGGDRRRRGSGSVRSAGPGARRGATQERDRALARGGLEGGRTGRLPGADPPELRPRRPGDADRLRSRIARVVLRRGGPSGARSPGAHRPIPGGRLRGRRRLPSRTASAASSVG